MLYLFSILFFVIIVIILNLLLLVKTMSLTFWGVVFMVLLSVLLVLLIDALIAFIVRWVFPKTWFGVSKKIFFVSKEEQRFYERLGIKKWKDKVVELGAFAGFRKNKILDPTNNEYVERFIVEANYGVVVHFLSCFFGFFVILFYPKFWFSIGIPVAIVNAFYNCLSMFILRYNLPKLHTLYKFNKRREKKIETVA